MEVLGTQETWKKEKNLELVTWTKTGDVSFHQSTIILTPNKLGYSPLNVTGII
jgi:hypothetical protein